MEGPQNRPKKKRQELQVPGIFNIPPPPKKKNTIYQGLKRSKVRCLTENFSAARVVLGRSLGGGDTDNMNIFEMDVPPQKGGSDIFTYFP